MEGIERVIDFCHAQRETLTDFYKKTGIDDVRIKAIRKRKSGMPEDVIVAIAKTYPELNMRWVITGEGGMLLQGNAGSVQQINNGVVENPHVVGAQNIRYVKNKCAECEAKLQEANNKIIELQARIISLLEKQGA